MIDFKCPHCNAEIETDDIYAGQENVCPQCGNGITIPSSDSKQKSANLAHDDNRTGYTVFFECFNCKKILEGDAKDAGKYVSCPICGRHSMIPEKSSIENPKSNAKHETAPPPLPPAQNELAVYEGQPSNKNLMTCPDCGGIVSIHAAACPHCGAPLMGGSPHQVQCPSPFQQTGNGMKKCPSCGTLLALNASTCPKCGRDFSGRICSTGFIIVLVFVIIPIVLIMMGGC